MDDRMTKPIPDHLSGAPSSPYYNKDFLNCRVSIDGIEYTGQVLEYNIPKGWAMVLKLDDQREPQKGRKKRPSARMKRGKVVVWMPDDPVPEGALNLDMTDVGEPPRKYVVDA